MLDLGFTGTRQGMTGKQRASLADHLERKVQRFACLHHGDCVGSDAEAHEIARRLGLYIVGHPPLNTKMRAYCDCDTMCMALDYIERNHAIVQACQELIATPDTMREKQRSGTWATVRYAREWRRMVTIVYPDGTLGIDP